MTRFTPPPWLLAWVWVVVEVRTSPVPSFNLHNGHIGLRDEVLAPDFNLICLQTFPNARLQKGMPYTLEIFMGNTDEYDYVVERCVANGRAFLGPHGCLTPDPVFPSVHETDRYTQPGSLKRTLVHFVATELVVKFECDVTVVRCAGCAERSCNRHPVFRDLPAHTMPITCTYPTSRPYNLPTAPYVMPPLLPPGPAPPAPAPPAPYPAPPAIAPSKGPWVIAGIPWWLWLLFLALLLLLLCCIIFVILCLLIRRRRRNVVENEYNGSEIYNVERDAKHSGMDANGTAAIPVVGANSKRQLDRHGSIRLRHERPVNQGPRMESRGYQAQGYDNFVGDIYEEDGMEKVVTETRTVYENYPNHDSIEYRDTNITPSYLSSQNQTVQQRLQMELEDYRRQQRRDQFRMEDRGRSRSSDGYRSRQVLHHPHESLREETVREIRQASVI